MAQAKARTAGKTAGTGRKKGGSASAMSAIADVLKAGRESAEEREQELLVHIMVAPDAPRETALAVKDCFLPQLATAHVQVEGMSAEDAGAIDPASDFCVVVSGPDPALAAKTATAWAKAGVATVIIIESMLDAPDIDAPESVASLISYVSATTEEGLSEQLAEWVLDVCEKQVACAANFGFCRGLLVDRLIHRCAYQCAGIGAVDFLNGADLVLMGGRQAKLALDIAACYGKPLDGARALEIAGVVGAGLAYRGVARAAVNAVPGLKHVTRGAIGYGGTIASGKALEGRFRLEESGALDPDVVREKVGEFFSSLGSALSPDDDGEGGGPSAASPASRAVAAARRVSGLVSRALPERSQHGQDDAGADGEGYITIAG